MSADSILDALVEFVVTDGHPSAEAVDRARDILVDTVGCALGGQECRGSQAAAGLAAAAGAGGDGAVIGHTAPVNAEVAAFWNTAAIRYLDYNDTYPAGHPSDLIGALWATLGQVDVSGESFLRALWTGHEIYARFAETVLIRRPQTIDQGYGIAIAATGAICRLLDLPEDQTRAALAIAATNGLQVRASRAGQLSHYKGMATAFSARDAIFVVGLARAGVSGPEAPFEGRHGIVELQDGQAGPLRITPFDRELIGGTRLKHWPTAYNIQPAIWAALDARRDTPVDQIERMVFHTAKFLAHESGSESAKWDPRTRETADHSLPYAVWRALSHGVVDIAAFEPEAFLEPAARPLMDRISVVPDADIEARWPEDIGVTLEVTDRAGTVRRYACTNPPGHDKNPMGEAELRDKFLRLSTPVLGEARAHDAFQTLWHVQKADSMGPVTAAAVIDAP